MEIKKNPNKSHTNKVSYKKLTEFQISLSIKKKKNFQELSKACQINSVIYIEIRKLAKHGKVKERTQVNGAKIERKFIIEVMKSCW